MLDQLESTMAMFQEINPLTQDAFLTLMTRLDEAERKGYFAFVRGGMGVLDKIVTSFSEEDIDQLGDNIVLILQTVKDMTQPEIMNLVNQSSVDYQRRRTAGRCFDVEHHAPIERSGCKAGLVENIIRLAYSIRKLIG